MGTKLLLAGVGLFLSLIGASSAAPQTTQGVISFSGSIVEATCKTGMTGRESLNVTFNLTSCSPLSRGNEIHALNVNPSRTVTAINNSSVNVKLIADTGTSQRYYDQQYVLVDGSGTPIRSGMYLITLTSP